MTNANDKTSVLRVLLADCDPARCDAVRALLAAAAHQSYVLDCVATADEMLAAIAADAHDVCLLGDRLAQGDAAGVLSEAVSTGWRAPVILLVDIEHSEYRREIHDLGGADCLAWKEIGTPFLDRAIRKALERKKDEGKFGATKEDLVRRLIDLQDAMERIEQLGAEHVRLAEELEGARADLESALAQVTESKEKLEILNQEKNKFFSIIAHDLRSPFTALLGLTEFMTMAGGKLKPEQFIDYAGRIHESGRRVFRLLENLLEWARLQMGRVTCEPAPQDLMEIIRDTSELFVPVAAEKQITIVNDVSNITVFADRPTLATVIRNLVNNAVKFTPPGGTVRIESLVENGAARVSVRDSGVGIAPDRVASLFRLGQATSTPGTTGEKGTGLGLMLCKQLVELNQGRIWVESEPGKGTAFHITVPLADAAMKAAR